MIVSIHQPAYLPWLGYLDRIASSDVFVFLDTVQFEKNSFTNRNRIKTANGPVWLTVPVKQKGHIDKSLLDIEIDQQKNWQVKHLRSIEQAYRKAPNFGAYMPILAPTITETTDGIAALCWRQLAHLVEVFGLETRIVRASELAVDSRKSDLVLDICKQLGATTYLSGSLGRDYLALDDFSAARIDVSFQDFTTPEYPQQHGEFIPNLSAIDYIFNAPSMAAVGTLF
ncbi:WbqC family protein [Mariluticola halotolerans]|uniref:WbqC family protein n=1 Tax=Mariluticola halotolerans TaxID=2909283 RepID=UPI0026E446DD|nr:WbqC family protein [Mariluticola halotolerans]UJQ96059.1 WbqC family protein [Mariluticola halotolerans]